jgi:TolB-like protein/Flp pilus assembly protein TadD
MPTDSESDFQLEIGHVLLIDIVGYSKLLITEQREQLQALNEIVRNTAQFRASDANGMLVRIPTGDGMALIFRDSVEAPLRCAVEISEAVKTHSEIHLRVGIHSGPVSEVTDVSERTNIAGAGIDIAQVMDCGDAKHILLSKHVADDLAPHPRWNRYLHDLGECEVKHGARVSVVNLYGDQFGNATLPGKFQTVQKRRARVRWAAGAAALLALAMIVGGIAMFSRYRVRSTLPVPEKSIAVLPFENLSEEKANAYFADGIQDEILTRLSGIGELKVISRKSTAKYKSAPEDLKTVARELGVATVLEGSVQRAGDKVRINVQLLDARIDTHLWAKSYDRDLKDVFTVESEVAQEIADTLRAKLSPSQADALATAPTRDTEAYDLFLKGEYEEHQAESALTAEPFDRAQTLYRQALARDPKFALAYARLAYSELYRHWYISPLTSAELAEVKSNIDRALTIAPALPDAHLALALFYYWGYRDYDPALRELDRAVELQPNSAIARAFHAYVYRRRGEWEQSLVAAERAAELDPRDPSIPRDIGVTYMTLRRWTDAEHALARALALDPHYAFAAQNLALTYIDSTGDIRRARRALEGVPAESGLGVGGDANPRSTIANMIGMRAYLDVFEKHFDDALEAWVTSPTNAPEARLRQLEARVGIQVIAGEGEVAKSECEQTRALLEARLAERPEDRVSLAALAWVYVCLGRNADALRAARQAADSLPIEKDALAGPYFLVGLAEIEARIGRAEEAVKILRQLITAPAGAVVSIARLKIDPVWDPIRNRPDFQQLLSGPEQIGPSNKPTTSAQRLTERPTFASDIRPILQSSCQPCHFQGGQMYEKLPFDKPETITKLGTKLFTRIKNEDQQRIIREFLSEQSSSTDR